VNATSPAGLELEFDITLRDLPCTRLNIDANDPNGQPQSLHLDRIHHVWKHRVNYDNDGKMQFVGDRSRIELGSTLLTEDILHRELEGVINATIEKQSGEYCGSCYGAGDEGECCNACDDVKRAYNLKGWVLRDLENIEQCKDELGASAAVAGEGCNIHGKVALSSGGGNLHLAPGRDMPTDGSEMSLFDLVLRTFEQWNVSHTVHKIRFGQDIPAALDQGKTRYQLDGEERIIMDTYGMYQYYFQVRNLYHVVNFCTLSLCMVLTGIFVFRVGNKFNEYQVVPTEYRFLNGTTIQTNQYSVTEHLRHVNPGSGRGLPGVFFFYEVSPLHVVIEEQYRKGWVAFFTSVCAVVGGVVTVMGIIDQSLFSLTQSKHEGLSR